jgi:hypothetical protein
VIRKKLGLHFIDVVRFGISLAHLTTVFYCIRYTMSNCGIILNDESERTWKETAVAYFKFVLLSLY